MLAATRQIFDRLSPGGTRNVADTLRTEAAAVGLLLAATVVALVWANSPWRDGYREISETVVGPAALHLDLTVAHWATDGLLAIFFFVVGLELKREVVTGELRRPATAVVPIVAAVGGMVVPALLYTVVNLTAADGAPQGWAVPVATDIAFAVAVLSAFGRRLPLALRAFLLTLAVVDDLLGIVVIAVFYSDGLAVLPLLGALGAVAVFGLAVRRRVPGVVLVALAVCAWGLMHASGVHSTIAGVLLGFTVPAVALPARRASAAAAARARGAHHDGAHERVHARPHGDHVDAESLAERYEHLWRPVSAGLAVPVFALFAAGVSLDPAALGEAVREPAAQGVALGLVVGKPVGILLATFLVARFTRASLAPGLGWWDVAAVSVVAGMGFTVSLLIAELSFAGTDRHEAVKAAVLAGSFVAAALGGVFLSWRNRVHGRLADAVVARRAHAHAAERVQSRG
ncbi:Na+/H+ antiporter NhaA [Actinotalea sp. AC32]|nr:Na+/H+ antiporter NhaA [Actinotalea sp. AC32]